MLFSPARNFSTPSALTPLSFKSTDFNHGNPGIVGGGMLADDFVFTPMMFWQAQWPADVPRWGQGAKHWMRKNFHHVTQARGPVQEIPTPHARVELDRHVRDGRGRAVARLSGTTHMETVRTARFMANRILALVEHPAATPNIAEQVMSPDGDPAA